MAKKKLSSVTNRDTILSLVQKYNRPAVLTSVPLLLVDDTVPVLPAGVAQLLPHSPLEEPLDIVID